METRSQIPRRSLSQAMRSGQPSSRRASSIARRALAVVLVVASAAILPSLVQQDAATAAPTLPAGFTWTGQPSGQPAFQLTDFVFLPEGGMLTTGKSGSVQYVDPAGESREVLKLTVDDRADIGLMGIEIANDYAVSGSVYLFYQYITPTGTVSRLSRWTADDRVAPHALSGQTVVLDGISVDNPVHAGGTVVVAPDNTLWVTVGESASHTFADPLALRAQDITDPHGKLLHIYPDGSGVGSTPLPPSPLPPGWIPSSPPNPHYDETQPNAWVSRVYAYGFRMPFRITLNPTTGVPYVGEVGWNVREEIDVVEPDANYGWPCWEGDDHTQLHEWSSACGAMYAHSPAELAAPLWSYSHAGVGASVTGGIFYTGESYPAEYRGAYFFGDYSMSKIWTLTTNGQDQLVRPPEANGFASSIGGPVRFRSGPGGDIFVADVYTGTIFRLRYTAGNRPATAVATATQTAPGGSTFNFEGAESYDDDGDPIVSYRWDFGDGVQSDLANPEHTYSSPGEKNVVLTVDDGLPGGSGSKNFTVVPGNYAPDLVLVAPPDGTTFAVGDPVSVSASASDQEDGVLDSSIAWRTGLQHCPGGVCHAHPGTTASGGSFTPAFSDHGSDTHMEITATVTDEAGVEVSKTYQAQPEVHTLTIGSSPPGVVLNFGGTNTATDSTFGVTALSTTTISAPERFGDLVFRGWNDGQDDRSHPFVMPRSNFDLEAEYAHGGIVAAVTSAPTTALGVGDTVTFQIAVHLPADADLPLSDIDLEHSACDDDEPARTGGDVDETLEVNETWTYSCSHELTAAEVPFYEVTTHVTGTSEADETFESTVVTYLPPLTDIGRYYFELGGPSSFLGQGIGPEQEVAGGRRQRFEGGTIYWSAATGAHEVHGAIFDKYQAIGGPSSFVGFPKADEADSPNGHFSTFQGSTIFWSAATGAYEIRGAVRDRYEALGGPGSFLGYPVTDELGTPVGTGRFNLFQGGSIYWSPESGAHEVHGAIRDKWASMGWEQGFLGYPTSNELVAPGGVGRLGRFAGGTVYWSPGTGGHEVHGAIRDLYESLGGPSSPLGFPVTDESRTPDGIGRYNHFQGGSIYWSPGTGAFEVRGAIRDKWASLAWERGFLGFPTSNELEAPGGAGRLTQFQGGTVYWSPGTGAHELHGAIRDVYESLGGPSSFLGYPVTDELGTLFGMGRFNLFQGGSIYWSPSTGAFEVHGAIRDKWASLGWEFGVLGFPTSNELVAPGGVGRLGRFAGGTVYWSPGTGAFEVHGAIRDLYESLSGPGSSLGYPVSDETAAPDGIGRSTAFEHGVIDWSPTTGAFVR